MTPTSHPAAFRGRRPAVLVQAVVWVVVVATVTTVAGGLLDGSSGARGAAVGGLISLTFFTFGSVVVNMATRLAPEAAMVVALTTYTLQVVLVVIAFALIRASEPTYFLVTGSNPPSTRTTLSTTLLYSS